MREKRLSRSALAKRTGCHLETIRYYEKTGLMPAPARNANGYRRYSDPDVRRLNFIMRCKNLGLSPDETKGLLDLVGEHVYTCGEIKEITEGHLRSVKSKIADLKKLERTLKAMMRECEAGDIPECPIIDALFDSRGSTALSSPKLGR